MLGRQSVNFVNFDPQLNFLICQEIDNPASSWTYYLYDSDYMSKTENHVLDALLSLDLVAIYPTN